MSVKKIRNSILEVAIYTLVITLLLISIQNIKTYLQPKKVLGIATTNNYDIFWSKFLKQNPNYVPGWIETGREDIVKQIDPNFF